MTAPIPRPADFRAGGPPPWADLDEGQRVVDLARARACLTGRTGKPAEIEHPDDRVSAVLVPLFEEHGELRVVLTLRNAHLRSHAGQVSFPGGRLDPGEDVIAAALREAREETALDPDGVEIIGELDHLRTIVSSSFIVPVVGVLPGRPELTPNPAEVDRIFDVSTTNLLADGVYREEHWGVGSVDRAVCFFEVEGETVWGATGTMLKNLLMLSLGIM
ncbi:MAG TPA: CoA pyrophosphatase [Acidimicrobiales bacterium]|nr:CoA pyrophosphatase [Acidimicrobiales bacterium]